MKKYTMLDIEGRRLKLEVADNFLKRAIGLSFRKDLKGVDGMLFKFPWRARWRMCMRGMKFPLDFIWLDGDKVVEVTRKVPITAGTLKPKFKIDAVIEIVKKLPFRQLYDIKVVSLRAPTGRGNPP